MPKFKDFSVKENHLLYKEIRLTGEEFNPELLQEALADPGFEACGIGAAQFPGASREATDFLLQMARDNEHRGGKILGPDGIPVGDGAGIAVRTKNDAQEHGMQGYLQRTTFKEPIPLDKNESLHRGHLFVPPALRHEMDKIRSKIKRLAEKYGLKIFSIAKENTDPSILSSRAKVTMPEIYKVTWARNIRSEDKLIKATFDLRLDISRELPEIDIVSLVPDVTVYKGMLTGKQLPKFYPDLLGEDFITDAGTVHIRFGTNTLAEWILAHPFELISHNGEVNSIYKMLKVLLNLERKNKINGTTILPRASDSANLDRVLRFLMAKGGLSLVEAVRFIIHPARDDLKKMPKKFQNYVHWVQRSLGAMRAIGPISIVGIDGENIVGARDENGLRPLRRVGYEDGVQVLASEVPSRKGHKLVKYRKIAPGGIVSIGRDCKTGNVEETTAAILANTQLEDFNERAEAKVLKLKTANGGASGDSPELKQIRESLSAAPSTLYPRLNLFGLNRARQQRLMEIIAWGKDPIEGMGSDEADPLLSPEPHSLGKFLRARYAQVSNPSIDFDKERKTFSTKTWLGARPEQIEFAKDYKPHPQYELDDPLLDDDQIMALYGTPEDAADGRPKVHRISTVFEGKTEEACRARIAQITAEVLTQARSKEHTIIILEDRAATGTNDGYIPPHILAAHLVRQLDLEGLAGNVSLVYDTGEIFDQHEFNTLISCGIKAVHPRSIYEMIDGDEAKFGATSQTTDEKMTKPQMKTSLRAAFKSTLLRYMGKLGMTNVDSYRGSKQFTTLRLADEFVKEFFGANFKSKFGGLSLADILKNQFERAKGDEGNSKKLRKSKERHGYSKEVMNMLQEAGGLMLKDFGRLPKMEKKRRIAAMRAHLEGKAEATSQFSETDLEHCAVAAFKDELEAKKATLQTLGRLSNDELLALVEEEFTLKNEAAVYETYLTAVEEGGPVNIRDLLEFVPAETAVPLSEVQSADDIIAYLLRGAGISLGAMNKEAWIAFGRAFAYKGKWLEKEDGTVVWEGGSYRNDGEGGSCEFERKDGERLPPRSVQVASGRFGIDIQALARPEVAEIQIKIGQGAKPGVGGHLPGTKVSPLIAEVRGVGLGQELISPATNHDIYCFEDLQALIDRLGAMNPTARIAVKITAGENVGTIGAGCVKTGEDQIQLSGAAGGTAAAALTDKFETGLPIEDGLDDLISILTQQGLLEHTLVGVDGGFRHGADVAKAIMMGADEVHMATFILIAQLKCIFCNNCSNGTCPANICRTISHVLGSSRDMAELMATYENGNKEQAQRLLYNGIRILQFLAEEIRKHMSVMGFRHVEEMKGRRDKMRLKEEHAQYAEKFDFAKFLEIPQPVFKTAQREAVDKLLASRARKFTPTYPPNDINFYFESPRVNRANKEIIQKVYTAQQSEQDPIDITIEPLTSCQRDIGATLGCLIVRGLIKVPSQGITIRTSGEAGQGFGTGVTHGVTLIHTGSVENETAAFQNGGRIVILNPLNAAVGDFQSFPNAEEIIGNTVAYGVRGGERFLQGSIADRGCIRETHGLTVIGGNTGKYFGEYKTGAVDIVLGRLGNEIGSGMSGGAIFTLQDDDLQNRLSDDVEITAVLQQKDREMLFKKITAYYEATNDKETGEILANWDQQQNRFCKIVAKSSYGTAIFQSLYGTLTGQPQDAQTHENLIDSLFEMLGMELAVGQFHSPAARNTPSAFTRSCHAQLHDIITQTAPAELKAEIDAINATKKEPLSYEEVFKHTQKFAMRLANELRIKIIRS
ncbi:hypothetical protein HY604_01230 [Candidatus Peregrinibacteria bacterium]|nr:hypothetical protein [Candidatus Peregrinibacteria bacterium]